MTPVARVSRQTAAAWDNVQVTVFRDPEDPIDPAGQCGTVRPGDDVQQLVLPSGENKYNTKLKSGSKAIYLLNDQSVLFLSSCFFRGSVRKLDGSHTCDIFTLLLDVS